jgi:hypothetical protein
MLLSHGIPMAHNRDPFPSSCKIFYSSPHEKIKQIRNMQGSKIWQRGYYDCIIRNENQLWATRRYIINNPLK